MWIRWLIMVMGAVFLLAGATSPLTAAHQVDVTAGVGDTTIRISGWTSPYAFVTLMENSMVVGTTTADAHGRYVLLLVSQASGIHTFRVFSRDSKGRVTEAVTARLNAAEHSETVINVFLPPAVSTSEQDDGSVIIEGSTVPHATVVIMLGDRHFTVKADAAGNWRYVFAAGELPASEYHISVAAILPGGLQSSVVAIPPLRLMAKPDTLQPATRPGMFWAGTHMPRPGGDAPDSVAKGEDSRLKSPATRPPEDKKISKHPDEETPPVIFTLLWLVVFITAWWLLPVRWRRDGDDRG